MHNPNFRKINIQVPINNSPMIPKQPIKIQINNRYFSAGDGEVDIERARGVDADGCIFVDGCIVMVVWGCSCTLVVAVD